MTPAPGSAAPEFALFDQYGTKHSLEDYEGSWVVLYFYPKDGTSGCTAEACGFRDVADRYEEKDIAVIGISRDSAESHRRFSREHSLPFTLLSDEQGSVIAAYGAAKNTGIHRMTFLIDPDGFVAKVYEHVNPKEHGSEILLDFEAMT